MYRLSALRWPACLALLSSLTAPAVAAQTTGAIRGRVIDGAGAPIPGVLVSVVHVGTGASRDKLSDSEGVVDFPSLPVGSYELAARLDGYRPLIQSGIDLAVRETLALVVQLELGGFDDEITVADAPPPINSQSGDLGFLVNEQVIETLPLNGRNFIDLALLQPNLQEFVHRNGGSIVAHGPGVSVNGQDPRSNVYLLDGTLLNDFTNGPAGSAASTSLGTETIREFRVETNAYGAEYGRNFGGQISIITKSGSNDMKGSAFEFHRNDALDERNYFDRGEKPQLDRHQFGGTLGGPIKTDRLFFFLGYEHLREDLGRTISSLVPDDNARLGLLPDPADPSLLVEVGVAPEVRPYLDAYPRQNGKAIGAGIAEYAFPFTQTIREDFLQARLDFVPKSGGRFFARYSHDDANQLLPTDFPQFPRSFLSTNRFFTAEYLTIASASTFHTLRGGWSSTEIGQDVDADLERPLEPFVAGRPTVGNIDIGGIPRFGPQISANVSLDQKVTSLDYSLSHVRGRHLLKAGLLAEAYEQSEFNPTFSRGLFRFPSLERFLTNRPAIFIGLTPEADLERQWDSELFALYLQDDVRVGPGFTLNLGLRYETASVPKEALGRDVSLPRLTDLEPTVGPLYRDPTGDNWSPRFGFAWDPSGDGKTAVRGGFGVYYNTNIGQNLIVTITNPPFTPRPVIPAPIFPQPQFGRGSLSIRPIQADLESPELTTWNLTVEREIRGLTLTAGHVRSRGRNLLRNSDVNVPEPEILSDGTPFFPAGTPRPNPAFSAIELKSSDGESRYRATFVDLEKRWTQDLRFDLTYTRSKSEDTTQASTFFSDATNGTTSAFPESFGPEYNRGPSDFHAKHRLIASFAWRIPWARGLSGAAGKLLDGWQLSGIGRYRSGNPLTVFVQNNWSRSLWAPALAPGVGRDRPSYAPGFGPANAVLGDPNQWFDPRAFELQARGTPGDTGRGDFIGPDLESVDLALAKTAPWSKLGDDGSVELRIEVFNLFNRVNFASPSLIAFTGTREGEAPLPSFGRIRATATSARQVQLGVRLGF